MTPLTGVQLSLSLLKDDDDVAKKLDPHHMELLTTAATSSELLIRICRSAFESLRFQNPDTQSASDAFFNSGSIDALPVTKMDELIKSLHMLMEPIPKKVPLVIRMSSSVPPMILSDDLKLFRSALNFLSSAATRTHHGGIQLRIYPRKGNAELVFECEDTGDDIPVEMYQYLYQPSGSEDGNLRMCLSSVASLISSLDGEYGFRPRVDTESSGINPAGLNRYRSGSVFWFSIPLFAPDSLGAGKSGDQKLPPIVSRPFSSGSPRIMVPKDPIIPRVNSIQSVSSLGKGVKLSIAVGDVLQADAVANSCFRDVYETTPLPTADAEDRDVNVFPSIPENIELHHNENNSDPFRMDTSDSICYVPSSTVAAHGSTTEMTAHLNPASSAVGTMHSSSERIRQALVIDDSLVIRKSLAMAFRKLGYEATMASNGLEGLNQMKESQFDLVLCDFLMPVMDGFDCVKQYREWEKVHRPTGKQLIIGISAHANNDVAKQGLLAGMDNFLPKPISIKTLTDISDSDAARSRCNQLNELFHPVELKKSEKHHASEPLQEASKHKSNGLRRKESDNDSRSSDDDVNGLSVKRPRRGSSSKVTEPICLMATDRPSTSSSDVLARLDSAGWKVVVVHDGFDSLRLLKMRNWDLVLVDDELTGLDGTECVTMFRKWESENRVNRQKNIFLVSEIDIPSPFDRTAIVQAPSCFDSVIRKPIIWTDLDHLLMSGSRDMSIVQ
jgi:CheY-like chemotaxis protein